MAEARKAAETATRAVAVAARAAVGTVADEATAVGVPAEAATAVAPRHSGEGVAAARAVEARQRRGRQRRMWRR